MPIALTDKSFEKFLNELRQIIGEDAVLTQSNISETYTQDWARDEVGRCFLPHFGTQKEDLSICGTEMHCATRRIFWDAPQARPEPYAQEMAGNRAL